MKHLAFKDLRRKRAPSHALVNTAGRMAELHAESRGTRLRIERMRTNQSQSALLKSFHGSDHLQQLRSKPRREFLGTVREARDWRALRRFSVVSTSNPSLPGVAVKNLPHLRTVEAKMVLF
jgi:hypothetical protein